MLKAKAPKAIILLIVGSVVSMGLVVGLSSCAGVVAGGAAVGATYAYVSGWLERDYEKNLDETYEATMQAAKNLDMTVVDNARSLSSADIQAMYGDTKYWIKLESTGENTTKVSVRAGLMGDEEASKLIHREIEKQI